MRVFHARVKNADACVSDTQTHFARVFWAQYHRPVLYVMCNYLLGNRSSWSKLLL